VALRSISLCAGIGGIDLGLARWCRTVCYVEREAFSASVLVARMEEAELDSAPVWDDLSTFDGRPWRGRVDLVTGGYPCQPFSFAGSRRGDADERHLWPHVRRIISEVEPPLCFFENVSGHVSLGLEAVVSDLEGMGYRVAALLLGAADVGASHRRERLWIMAYSDRERCDGEYALLQQRRPRGHSLEASRRCAFVGHSNRAQLEGRNGPIQRRAYEWPAWPPGPEDDAAWAGVSEEAQPAICRVADGLPARVDRLRSLGNAVVPACAAEAFELLARSLIR
jgi:DNA (cytosine-5)-methyltransferase 1